MAIYTPPIDMKTWYPSKDDLVQWIYDIWVYLSDNPIVSTNTVAQIISDYLDAHPVEQLVKSVNGMQGDVIVSRETIGAASEDEMAEYKTATSSNTTAIGKINDVIPTLATKIALASVEGQAQNAQTTADVSKALGENAQLTADAAATTASHAQTTADTAVTNVTELTNTVAELMSVVSAITEPKKEEYDVSYDAESDCYYVPVRQDLILSIVIRSWNGDSVAASFVSTSYKSETESTVYIWSNNASVTTVTGVFLWHM